MMIRVLLLIALIWLIYWVVSRFIESYRSSKSNHEQHSEAQSEAKPSNLKASNVKIVQCSRCGCHVPESESHLNNHQVICNNAQCNEKQ